MASCGCRDTLQTGSVQANAIQVETDRAVCRRREVHPRARWIDAVCPPNLPLALRDLPDERAAGSVMIKMPPAATLAEPEERTIFEPDRIDARILPSLDPCLAGFPQYSSRLAGTGACAVQVEPCLRAVLNLIDHIAAVRRPADIDDEEVRVP